MLFCWRCNPSLTNLKKLCLHWMRIRHLISPLKWMFAVFFLLAQICICYRGCKLPICTRGANRLSFFYACNFYNLYITNFFNHLTRIFNWWPHGWEAQRTSTAIMTAFPMITLGLTITHKSLLPPSCLGNKVARIIRIEHRRILTKMFGQAVRRFTTSAVRASHYAEGPGQVLNLLQFNSLFQM